MQIDANKVIEKLMIKIAHLELEIAKLQVILEEKENGNKQE